MRQHYKLLYSNELRLLFRTQHGAKDMTRIDFFSTVGIGKVGQMKTLSTFFEQIPIEMVDKILNEFREKTEEKRNAKLSLGTRPCRNCITKGTTNERGSCSAPLPNRLNALAWQHIWEIQRQPMTPLRRKGGAELHNSWRWKKNPASLWN